MNNFKKVLNFHFFISILLLSLSCTEAEPLKKENVSRKKTEYFTLHIGQIPILAELAILPKEREKGLMYRNELKPGTGMLFVFKSATPQKFWMKNTRIPLDIGYFSSDGVLKEIHAAKPFDLSGVPSRSKAIQFVLELDLKGFGDQGLKVGNRLNLDDIRNAISKRGFDPQDYLPN
jgi:uncharacterized membrane protein (UPF0127 family)